MGGPESDRCQGTSRSVWGEDAFGQVVGSWWDVYRERTRVHLGT